MLRKLWRTLAMIANRNRIPPLPRGMLATAYDEIPSEEGRVLARLGARDPIGVNVAMRRAGVDSLEDLVAQLKHYQPEREFQKRLEQAIGRVVGGVGHDPHRAEIMRDERHSKQSARQKEIEQRVKRTRKAFQETNK
jgi:hypothetical protein